MSEHKVQDGECLTSIADHYGFFWQTLWNHEKNAKLREKRKDPNTLLPGDVVFIPEKRLKRAPCGLGRKHQFRLRGIPALFRLQLFDGPTPRSSQDFELEVDGEKHSGTTDEDGVLEVAIPASAKAATLTIGPDKAKFGFQFGHMAPITELAGVQARLNNLGFPCGEAAGELDDATREALRKFQSAHGLEISGEADDATRDKLHELHDSVGDVTSSPDADDDA
jgi:hypothetical protein